MAYRPRYLSGQQATTVTIAEKAITEDKIGDKAVGNAQLADDAVTTEKIADGAVDSPDIKDGAVKTVDLADSAVTTPKIANSAVTSEKLADTILTRPITPGVTADEIGNLAVTTGKVAEDAITNSKIGPGAVGATELAGDAVETAKIKDDAVTAPKIAAGAVGNTEIAADAVRGTEIQDGAVSAGKIGTDAVTTVKIKDDNVTTPKILDDAVTTPKILDDNVTTPKILDLNVTEPKLANQALSARLFEWFSGFNQFIFDDFLGAEISPIWALGGTVGAIIQTVSDNSEVDIIPTNIINSIARMNWNAVQSMKFSMLPKLCCHYRLGELTNSNHEFGFYKDATHYIYFRRNTAVSNNWYAVSRNGAAEETTDTGILGVITPLKFKIDYEGVGSVKFYIDTVLKATHTTENPAEASSFEPQFAVETLEVAVKHGFLDWFMLGATRVIA